MYQNLLSADPNCSFPDGKLLYYNSTFLSNVIFSKYFVSDII